MARLLLFALAAVQIGCVVDGDLGAGPYLCMSEPRLCERGFVCVAGRCVRPDLVDASVDSVPVDSGLPTAPVVPAFAPPTVVAELSSGASSEDDASLSADRLVVVFERGIGGVGSIMTSTRASVTEPWPLPVLDNQLSSPSNETTTALSADGLSILFGSDRGGGAGATDVYLSTRQSRAAAWSTPINLASLNGPGDDLASWVADDRLTVALHSDRGGNFDFYLAKRASVDAEFGEPQPIGELNTAANEFSLRFAADGLVATLHLERAGGLGSTDIYAATRANNDEPFGQLQPVVGINSPALDEDAWLSDDLCYLMFATDDDQGNRQIFEATCIR